MTNQTSTDPALLPEEIAKLDRFLLWAGIERARARGIIARMVSARSIPDDACEPMGSGRSVATLTRQREIAVAQAQVRDLSRAIRHAKRARTGR